MLFKVSPAKTQIQPLWNKGKLFNFSLNALVFLTIIQHVFSGSDQTLVILANLLFALLSLRQACTIFKENPSSQQHPSGLLQSLYSWNKQSCWGGRKWHKYLSFNKRKNKNKRNTGRKWNKRSWWQSWCWASNARWVIINTKEKILDSIPHNCHK